MTFKPFDDNPQIFSLLPIFPRIHSLRHHGHTIYVPSLRESKVIAFFVLIIIVTEVCKAPTLRLKAPWYNRTGWLGVKHQATYFEARTRLKIPLHASPKARNTACSLVLPSPHFPFAIEFSSIKGLVRWTVADFTSGLMNCVSPWRDLLLVVWWTVFRPDVTFY